jgi:Restriction endonuclease fold toxin 5
LLLRLIANALNAANAGGPGEWELAYEGWNSARAFAYQEQITGESADLSYSVRGVKFDGYRNGVLQEAKGPGYEWAVKNGEFISSFKGAQGILEQGQAQAAAANGAPLTWSVAEEPVVAAIQNLFAGNGIVGINVVYVPPVG